MMEEFKEKILPDVTQHKIPCYVVAFFLFDEFKRCIDCLLSKSEYLDIKIIENYSKYTDKKFKPYILDLLNKGLISEYFLFEKNISNNAIREIFYNYIDWGNIESPFIMISDGDLLLEGDWLEEEIDILTKNNEVFCVGMELTLENLPKVEGADKWVPKAETHPFKNYKIGATGLWTLLFKSKDLNDMINHFKKRNKTFIDGAFHEYATQFDKVWARTKNHKAYHLTWDIDSLPEHEYHEFRNRPFSEKWCHKKTCSYTVYKNNGKKNVVGLSRVAKVFSGGSKVPAIKTILKNITPPIIWKLIRMIVSIIAEKRSCDCSLPPHINRDCIKLHLGCGFDYKDGWINIDNNSDKDIQKLDLKWDLRKPLPFPDNSVDFIYNEHFLEHLTVEEGIEAIKKFYRLLKPGGVMRIAMPDLEKTVHTYMDENWKENNKAFLEKFGLTFIQTRAEGINIDFRWWSHKWLYDWEELERRLKEAGCEKIKRCPLFESEHNELKNLETRNESTLIAEVTK